ncbi:MAG: hypothetical protein ACTSU3_09145 [Candidatus Thorarchaeota archaeon]
MPIFDSTDVSLLRDFVLLFDGGIVFYSILFGIILLGQWHNQKYRSLVDLKIAWSIFFFGVAANSIAFMLSDFRFTTEPFNTYCVTVGYVALILAISAFFFAVEKILPYKTRHAFTVMGILSSLIILFLPRSLFNVLAIIISFVALVGVLLFLRHALRNTIGKVRRNVELIVAGFLLGWIGFIGRSDFIFDNLGVPFYVIGITLLLVGILIFGLTLTYSVALDELDWQSQLVTLYVIKKGGILVYHHDFIEDLDVDQVLTAAGISGVQSLLQEITNSEDGLNIVSIGNYEILFAHGSSISAVLITKEPYHTLLSKVEDFIHRFELIFTPLMGMYSAYLSDFVPANELVEIIFSSS